MWLMWKIAYNFQCAYNGVKQKKKSQQQQRNRRNENQKFWLRYCFDTEDLLICSFVRRKQYIFYDVYANGVYLLLNGK